MTLVEVVAGIALLGTLVATLILTHAQHLQQARLSEKRLEAVSAADELLTRWQEQGLSIPHSERGMIEGSSGFTYRTSLISNPAAEELGLNVVRLEILSEQEVNLTTVEIPIPQSAGD